MGLFDGLLSVFGSGDERESAAGSTADSRTSVDGPPNQSHGSHWDTVLADEGNWPEPVEAALDHAMEHGTRVESQRNDVSGVRYDEGPGTVWVTVDDRDERSGEIVSFYPGIDGTDVTLSVHGLREWATGVEAWVQGDLGPATVSTFPTNFFARERDAFGGNCEVSLAAMLYEGGPHETGSVSLAGGDAYELGAAAAMNETEGGAPDDYYFQTSVEDVERVSGDLFDGYLIEAPFFRKQDAGVDVPGTLYLGSHVAGSYEPAVGDAIEGAGWLQARFL